MQWMRTEIQFSVSEYLYPDVPSQYTAGIKVLNIKKYVYKQPHVEQSSTRHLLQIRVNTDTETVC